MIRRATDDDMRGQTSTAPDAELWRLPFLYLPTEDPAVMRRWGVAMAEGDGSVAVYERLFPGSLVAPKHMGQYVERGELLYNGAEPAAAFVSVPPASPAPR